MKTNGFFITLAIMAWSITATAQSDSSGIYLTATDFQNKVLSYAIDCSTEKHVIRLNDMSAYTTIIHNGEKIKLAKDRIYGAKLCSGKTYRWVKRVEYEVLNPNDQLLLYRHEVVSTAKNYVAPKYFFSTGADSQLVDLAKANLKNAFPASHKFHDELDKYFKDDKSLLEFDDYHSQYKLVRIFLQASDGMQIEQ